MITPEYYFGAASEQKCLLLAFTSNCFWLVAKQVSAVKYSSGKGRVVAALGSYQSAATASLDPDDYELFEDAYDSDDYEEVCLRALQQQCCQS